MAIQTINSFTTFELSEQEQINCAVLNAGQAQLLQNDLAMAAQQLLNLDAPTAESLADFTRNWASIQSRIVTIREILDRSEQARETLERLATLSATGQTAQ